MTNEFYEPGANREERVQELFARIAPRYDLINDLQSFGLHRRWKRKVIELACVKPSQNALDLCCGTGDVAFMLGRSGAQVLGVDFSQPMLEVAQERAKLQYEIADPPAAGSTKCRIEFIQGNALKLPFPDASFDVVTIAYGLRNIADTKAGLKEMRRVAKPGARLFVLDFGKPDNPAWRAAYFTYLRIFVPVLGRVFCGSASAYAYILESIKHYPGQRGVAAQMSELGLTNVRIVNLLGGVMSINWAEVGDGEPRATKRI